MAMAAMLFAVTGLKLLRLLWGMFKVNAIFARRQFQRRILVRLLQA
jgi:hypothetical protein